MKQGADRAALWLEGLALALAVVASFWAAMVGTPTTVPTAGFDFGAFGASLLFAVWPTLGIAFILRGSSSGWLWVAAGMHGASCLVFIMNIGALHIVETVLLLLAPTMYWRGGRSKMPRIEESNHS